MYEVKNTLLVNSETAKQRLLFGYNVKSSIEFLDCADLQLTALFIKLTGIKPSKNVCLGIKTHKPDQQILEAGGISKLNFLLYINQNTNPIVILWKSKSGRIYKISDEDIDCSDIQFWFDNLDTALYLRQLYPTNLKVPFASKDLPFELVVTRLNLDCTLIITVNDEYSNHRNSLLERLYKFIGDFNNASEKKSRKWGVIHNVSGRLEGRSEIVVDIDLGSADFLFFKKLFLELSGVEGILKVEIT